MSRNRRRNPERAAQNNSAIAREPGVSKESRKGGPRKGESRRGASGSNTAVLDKFRSYLQNHRHLLLSTLKRLLAEPVQTLMTSLVVAVALGLPAALYIGVINLQQLGSRVETTAQITVFLQKHASEQAITQMRKSLLQETEIESVDYVPSEQALEEFRASSGFGDVLAMLDQNPLPPVFIVQPSGKLQNDLKASEQLSSRLRDMPLVDDVLLDMKWMQRLQGMLLIGERLALSMGLALAMGVLLIIGNTIRLAIESRRDEIVVVKLVGGTNAYVRRPFLYTGIWYGFIGGLLAWFMVTLGLQWIAGPVAHLAALYQSLFRLEGLGFNGFAALLLIGAALGLIGAWLAVARHLSSIEPK